MSSNPPGYQPVYNPQYGVPVNQGQAVHGVPIGMSAGAPQHSNVTGFQGGYVPMSPFEPGYDEYQKKLKQQQMQGPQGFNYNDPRHQAVPEVKTVRSNNSIEMYCYKCRDNVHTEVVSYPGPYAWGACIVCCLVGCCLFMCIPLCLDPLTKSKHFCDRCRTLIAEND